jgi:hypothetical protein
MQTQFQNKGFEVVKGFIPTSFANYLRSYLALRAQNDPSLKADSQVPNALTVYGDPAFDTLMAVSIQQVENAVGKKLIPQYTYARIYNNGDILKRHLDRPECEYSVTLCLGGDYDNQWPIWLKDYDGKDYEVPLDEGDCVIYKGTELEHWREKFEGNIQYQLFMHYVDSEGEYNDRVYDGRVNLGL